VWLVGDATRLTQVLTNLLNNAAKFTPPGGHVRLMAERSADEVVVSVRDDGIGIPADKLAHVFELFLQVDRSLDRSQGGLGVGLTLVQRLIELHGGKIEAHSAGPGQGSEFVVRLPVANVQPVQSGQAGPIVPAVSRRVLIADDNEDAAVSLGMVLRASGHEVRTARDGLEAVEEAARFLPEVLVLDLGMPRLNGYEAARRIRQQEWGKEMLLIALTGWGQQEDRGRSQQAGFDAHLVKPADPVALQALLVECGR
jgi:CheY-like chemotaxis protein